MNQTDVSPSLLPRLGRLLRLLMQLRFVLTGLALLLLLSGSRLSVPIAILTALFAALTALVTWQWRRITPYLFRHPLLVTLDIAFAAAILAVDGPAGSFFVATVLTSTVAGLLFGTWRVVGVVSFQILCYVTALLSYSAVENGQLAIELLTFQVLLVNPVLYPVAGFVGIQLRRIFVELAAEQRRRQEAEIVAASAEERARLARDMHDSVTKTLRGAAMAAQSLPVWVAKDPERAVSTAAQVVKATETAAQEARDLISDLRADTPNVALRETVRTVLDEWSQQSGVATRLEAPEQDVTLLVTARHETVAILREALANVERHANAANVTVTVETEPAPPTTPVSATRSTTGDAAQLMVRIADDGAGFDQSTTDSPLPHSAEDLEKPGHYGLVGMHERAQRAGGSLTISSSPGAGSELTLRMPCAPPERISSDSEPLPGVAPSQ